MRGGGGDIGILSRLETILAEATSRLDLLASSRLRNWIEELAALHALQVQAQSLLDMVMRIAAELGYAPESPEEAARTLLNEGIITEDDYNFIRRVIGFRNVIVHVYMDVDMNMVERIIEYREYHRVSLLASKLLKKAVEKGIDP
ncbi:MAG: DUF86 domain-containing protein [Desulfurococcales archaeon]|nr:DUF86 domain-containing protein [Desulfurococcales archaeon]